MHGNNDRKRHQSTDIFAPENHLYHQTCRPIIYRNSETTSDLKEIRLDLRENLVAVKTVLGGRSARCNFQNFQFDLLTLYSRILTVYVDASELEHRQQHTSSNSPYTRPTVESERNNFNVYPSNCGDHSTNVCFGNDYSCFSHHVRSQIGSGPPSIGLPQRSYSSSWNSQESILAAKQPCFKPLSTSSKSYFQAEDQCSGYEGHITFTQHPFPDPFTCEGWPCPSEFLPPVNMPTPT